MNGNTGRTDLKKIKQEGVCVVLKQADTQFFTALFKYL